VASGYPDYEGNKSKTYTVADWAAKEGTSLNKGGVHINDMVFGEYISEAYTVPTGKVFYITQFYFSSRAVNAADGDKSQMCFGQLQVAGFIKLFKGGNGGGSISPITPIPVVAGVEVIGNCVCYANHAVKLGVGYGGYEV